MERAARQFARRIILIHVLLLAAVAGVTVFALIQVRRGALEQAMDAASQRQRLLARQTAAGVAGFYASIADNLDLAGAGEGNEPPLVRPGAPIPRGLPLLLWDQLQHRVIHFITAEHDPNGAVKNVRSFPPSKSAEAQKILDDMRDWLHQSRRFDVSPFRRAASRPVSLVVANAPPPARRMLVAVVSAETIRQGYLDDVTSRRLSAMVVNEQGTVMVSSGGGQLAIGDGDARLAAVVEAARLSGRATRLFRDTGARAAPLVPLLATVEPIDLLSAIPAAGPRRWYVVIASDLAQVDSVVNDIFHSAMLWAVFVVAAMTTLMLSSSTQLIRSRLRAERERHDLLSRELDQARRIQLAWLPTPLKAGSRFRLAAVNQPASHISGDFYDWFVLPDSTPGGAGARRLVVTIGDVTGHGMAAAFLMATTQLLLRSTMLRLGDPARCLEEVNRQLCVQVFNGQFVTALVLVLEEGSGELLVSAAGHFAPLVSEGEDFQPLPMDPQLVLGVERDVAFHNERYTMSPGTTLLLYTDGVVDARSADDQRFALHRLIRSLRGAPEQPRAVLDRVIEAVREHRGGTALIDDLTLVAVHLKGAPIPAAALAPA